MTTDPTPTTPQPPDAKPPMTDDEVRRLARYIDQKNVGDCLRMNAELEKQDAELARLRADLAAALENNQRLQQTVALYHGPHVTVEQGHWDEVETELARLRADLAAAAERERVLREAIDEATANCPTCVEYTDGKHWWCSRCRPLLVALAAQAPAGGGE